MYNHYTHHTTTSWSLSMAMTLGNSCTQWTCIHFHLSIDILSAFSTCQGFHTGSSCYDLYLSVLLHSSAMHVLLYPSMVVPLSIYHLVRYSMLDNNFSPPLILVISTFWCAKCLLPPQLSDYLWRRSALSQTLCWILCPMVQRTTKSGLSWTRRNAILRMRPSTDNLMQCSQRTVVILMVTCTMFVRVNLAWVL
jgi:hypothetical protein